MLPEAEQQNVAIVPLHIHAGTGGSVARHECCESCIRQRCIKDDVISEISSRHELVPRRIICLKPNARGSSAAFVFRQSWQACLIL